MALLPGRLTPYLQEQLAHLGTWMPFRPAAAMLQRFTQVAVSEASARRLTEVVGQAAEAVEAAQGARIEQELPPPPAGPDQALLSADGAMVPLRGGGWAEVKTLAVGQVVAAAATGEAQATALSYCSRLADIETFNRAVLPELHRRGIETAGQVAAVSDGAEWIQGFVDLHCSRALRILDFAHAAERFTRLGQALAPNDPTWLPTQLHRLKHNGPTGVLADLRPRVAASPTAAAASPAPVPSPPEAPTLAEDLAYLERRVGQMQYPAYQAAGWPIGSGCVESANKLVVEARLKGAGMHWAPLHVNPMLVLRNAVCNDRWDEVWAASSVSLRQHPLPRCPLPLPPPPARIPPPPHPVPPSLTPLGPHPPAPTHPWRRYGLSISAKK